MSKRLEFVLLALQPGANVRELCRRESISPKTAYKWIGRYQDGGGEAGALNDQSRKPLRCEQRSAPELEAAVVQVRRQHPSWGGRKIARRLQDLGRGHVAPSTVTSILHRHGLICPQDTERASPVQRFEHEQPNDMWQMDFKGTFNTVAGPCYALTVLDDHSRFNLALQANARMGSAQVQPQLEAVFNRYGMPARINTDNGPPWGSPGALGQLSTLGIWLVRLGIHLSHSRPNHPQTNGKIERFHRTLDTEVIATRLWADHDHVQHHFDRWRSVYNLQRPHEALQLQPPVQRYRASALAFPRTLPPITYGDDDTVVRVTEHGVARFKGERKVIVSQALKGLPVAFRARHDRDGTYDLYFCHQKIGRLDLNGEPVDT